MRPLALLLFWVCGLYIVSGATTIIDPTFCSMWSPVSTCPTIKNVDVLVMGAGMAGVSAAHTLYDHGLTNAEGTNSVQVVEGQSLPGGRVKRDFFQGFYIEVGANWFAGGEGSPTFELAFRYGLKYETQLWWNIETYRQDGTRIRNQDVPSREFANAYECLNVLGDACQANLDSPECTRSTREVLEQECGWYVDEGDSALKDIVEYYDMDYEFAQNPSSTNLQFEFPVWAYVDFQDKDFFVDDQRGYSHIVKEYAKEFDPNLNEHFVFGREVCRIDWQMTDGFARVHTQNATSCITYIAKKVIWTPSHGVLQNRADTIFLPKVHIFPIGTLPPLPPELGPGEVAKPDVYTMAIYIKVSKYWFSSSPLRPGATSVLILILCCLFKAFRQIPQEVLGRQPVYSDCC